MQLGIVTGIQGIGLSQYMESAETSLPVLQLQDLHYSQPWRSVDQQRTLEDYFTCCWLLESPSIATSQRTRNLPTRYKQPAVISFTQSSINIPPSHSTLYNSVTTGLASLTHATTYTPNASPTRSQSHFKRPSIATPRLHGNLNPSSIPSIPDRSAGSGQQAAMAWYEEAWSPRTPVHCRSPVQSRSPGDPEIQEIQKAMLKWVEIKELRRTSRVHHTLCMSSLEWSHPPYILRCRDSPIWGGRYGRC